MKIYSFIKRLNATELGLKNTNETFIAIPKEVDLSEMFTNKEVLKAYDRHTGKIYPSENSTVKFRFEQTGQNGQDRIYGLGEYYKAVDAHVGDEILIERVDNESDKHYFIDFYHRNAIVFIKKTKYVEILTPEKIEQNAKGQDYSFDVLYNKNIETLLIKFVVEKKEMKTSPNKTKFYDLQIQGESILSNYDRHNYIEIIGREKHLRSMKTYYYSIIETLEVKE